MISVFTFCLIQTILTLITKCLAIDFKETPKKPNIMVIFADDVGTGDVPGYWDNDGSAVDMPNLRQFLDSGTTFTDAHSTPLCATSRYMFLSGNYQHRGVQMAGTWAINYKHNQFRHGQQSIAEVLRDNGYDTNMVGKWHLGGKIPLREGHERPAPFPERTSVLNFEGHDWTRRLKGGPWDIGFNKSYITVEGIQNPPYIFFRNSKIEYEDLHNNTYWGKGTYEMPHGMSVVQREGEGANDWDSTAYNMILVNETEKFLEQHLDKHKEKPFFSYVALGAVHGPHSPPFEYLDGSSIAGQHDTPHKDLLFEMDKVVGSLLEILEEKKLLEDTIVVFTSDNGGLGPSYDNNSSGLLRESKGSIYEGGHRIPMTIRWDKGSIPRGETRSHLVGLNDLFATLCDLARVDIPDGQAIDSVSFANYLLNEDMTHGLREYLGTWRFQWRSFFAQAIRKGEMKLVHRYQEDTFELYNLTADISEVNDISEDNQELVEHMFEKLKEIAPCYDRVGKFDVNITWENKIRRKSCSWFGDKGAKNNRCKSFKEGPLYCRLTCAPNDDRLCQRSDSTGRNKSKDEYRLMRGTA